MIRNTELVTLIQTLAAAEQGSFHKAGLQFGVPASTISRRVRSLEAQIGVRLFSRHRHGIRRTAAGDGFLEQIRRILGDLNLVLVNTSTARRRHDGLLRIGLYVSPWRGQLRAVLKAYKHRFPNVRIQYTEAERRELMARLAAGAIDVAIVADHARHGPHDVIALWREKILVAMSSSHRLARKRNLAWEDLREEKIFLGRDAGGDLRDHLMARLKTSRRQPAIHSLNVGRDFCLSLVGLEPDVTLVYESDAGTKHQGVTYRELTDSRGPSLVPYYACWMGHNDNPALRHFLDLLARPEATLSDTLTASSIDPPQPGDAPVRFDANDT